MRLAPDFEAAPHHAKPSKATYPCRMRDGRCGGAPVRAVSTAIVELAIRARSKHWPLAAADQREPGPGVGSRRCAQYCLRASLTAELEHRLAAGSDLGDPGDARSRPSRVAETPGQAQCRANTA